MSRERMVTRTVSAYNYTVMTVNTNTAEVANKVFTITGDKLENAQALKSMQKLYNTDELKLVAIVEMTESVTLYGMPETEFIKLAKVLPPRKVYSEQGEAG